MLDIPIYLIEKYMPYIRIYFNYGFRLDYPTSKRLLSTHLVWLSITPFYKDYEPLEGCDVDFIRTSSNMKRLEGVAIGKSCSDMIGHLRKLEHLHLIVYNMEQLLQQALQPISQTIKAIHLEGDVSGIQGMEFPNLKELEVIYWNFENPMDVLNRCPNLESLKSWDVCADLLKVLKSGACVGVRKLYLDGLPQQNQDLEEMLEGRTGIQQLDLSAHQGSYRLSSAINRHASTLTHLSLEMKEFCMRTVFHILGCCGHLKDVSLGSIERERMERVLWKTHWKNPGILKRVQLSSFKPDDTLIIDPRTRYTQELKKTDRLKRPTESNGWIVPTGEPIWPDDRLFLNTLFMAAQGFTRLGTITIDSVSYTKAFH
ncbi:hypothetical protein B0O80DRAFT_454892 [Mortierella sp. GBAus27b]|nr:hypothetical protein B0O80DRAFT_454892 [Mortierella sp. GBAus27b]